KPSYTRLTEHDGSLWRREAWPLLSGFELNQLWRNHLLVESMCRHPRPSYGRTGRSAVVHHPGDVTATAIIDPYRSSLVGPDQTFCDWPLDRLVDAWSAVAVTEDEKSWLAAFRLRYLDLTASEHLVRSA